MVLSAEIELALSTDGIQGKFRGFRLETFPVRYGPYDDENLTATRIEQREFSDYGFPNVELAVEMLKPNRTWSFRSGNRFLKSARSGTTLKGWDNTCFYNPQGDWETFVEICRRIYEREYVKTPIPLDDQLDRLQRERSRVSIFLGEGQYGYKGFEVALNQAPLLSHWRRDDPPDPLTATIDRLARNLTFEVGTDTEDAGIVREMASAYKEIFASLRNTVLTCSLRGVMDSDLVWRRFREALEVGEGLDAESISGWQGKVFRRKLRWVNHAILMTPYLPGITVGSRYAGDEWIGPWHAEDKWIRDLYENVLIPQPEILRKDLEAIRRELWELRVDLEITNLKLKTRLPSALH